MRKFWRWIVGAAAAVGAFLVWALFRSHIDQEVGRAKGKADAERERLDDAVKSGDDEAVAGEWRRHRK